MMMERYVDIIERTGLYPTFSLEKAVCNHGLFMMAPNRWIPSIKTFQRPLRLSDSTSVIVSISSYGTNYLLIRVHDTLLLYVEDKHTILAQVRRMLRISGKDENDVAEFHKSHPQAKQSGFGRIFRSPTLFEDVVKSILLCNCGTLEMAQALCELQGELVDGAKGCKTKNGKKILQGKRKRFNDEPKSLANFPSPKELADLDKESLNKHCKLGYRADYIIRFAADLQNDELRLIKEFEDKSIFDSKTYDDLFTTLMRRKGFGPFASANILMCCGSYKRIPEDTETVRHLSTFHAREDCKKENVKEVTKEVYGKYAPFQCLAYWWELTEWYQGRFGRLSELPRSSYSIVTGTTKI